jgi:hypothetical protein
MFPLLICWNRQGLGSCSRGVWFRGLLFRVYPASRHASVEPTVPAPAYGASSMVQGLGFEDIRFTV